MKKETINLEIYEVEILDDENVLKVTFSESLKDAPIRAVTVDLDKLEKWYYENEMNVRCIDYVDQWSGEHKQSEQYVPFDDYLLELKQYDHLVKELLNDKDIVKSK